MKLQRIDSVNSLNGNKTINYELPKQVNNEYLIDDSCFIPMSEAVKQLGINNSGHTNINTLYDFKDGIDDGSAIPFNRQRAYKDIAELSTAINEQMEIIKEDIEVQAKLQKTKEDFQNRLNAIDSTNNTPKTE